MTSRTLSMWIVTLIIMGGSSVALRCEDRCYDCSTTSISCSVYRDRARDLPDVVSVLPQYTQAFQYLASGTKIQLGKVNFTHLTELKTLTIRNNYQSVEAIISPIPSSAQSIFDPLKKLQILRINIKWYFEHPLDDLFRPLVNLEELDLSQTKTLNITNLQRAMNGLSNSTTLQKIKLFNIQTFEHSTYSTLNLTWFLEPVKNCPITRLYLAYNAFKIIFPGIIRYAPRLEYIDVSHNLLEPILTSAFFIETLLHKGLQEADFSYQGLGYHKGNTPTTHLRTFTRKLTFRIRKSLGTGTLQQRIATIIPHDATPDAWVECINATIKKPCEAFSPNCSDVMNYLRNNHGQFCELLYTIVDDPPSENFYHGIPCSALPTVDDMFQEDCFDCIVIPTMGSISRIILNNLNIYDAPKQLTIPISYPKCFHQSNKLEYLDLSENFDMDTRIFPYIFPLTLRHINILNVSNTGITQRVFEWQSYSFSDLQVLDMSRNKIVALYWTRFAANGSMQNLSFAHNLIRKVNANYFANLVSLRELDLSHNRIERFDFNISGLYSLETLNMEYNMISEIPSATRQQLIQLAERVAPQTIIVNLSNNQLHCSCYNIPFLTFMLQTKPSNLVFTDYDKYRCRDQAGNLVSLHKMNFRSLWFDCLGSGVYVGIGFACASVVIIIILLLALTIYRKRWWFRYQYFLAHRVWKNYHKIETLDTSFEYDLFVSYNQHDYQWVDKVLQPKLEDELGLCLCLHHRDFRLGEIITEQIVESIESSKKTLFILSKSFLASTWCHFEIRMAQSRLFTSGKDVILLALLEPLPDHMVSKTLKDLLETRTYVEWTESDTYGQKLFWEKLYESVKAPITQPFDLEERAPPPGIQMDEMRDSFTEEEAAEEGVPLLDRSWPQLPEI